MFKSLLYEKGFVITEDHQCKALRNRITGNVFVDHEVCRGWDKIARRDFFKTPEQAAAYYGSEDPYHESLAP